MIGIYKITSITGRIYIGQSRDIIRRFKSYNKFSGGNKYQIRLHRSFLKHGVNSHIFEILEECEISKLNIRERYWQDYFNVIGENGLNCRLTSSDVLPGIISEETRLKKSGVNHPMWGKTHKEESIKMMQLSASKRKASEKTREILSEARKGDKNHFFGKTHKNESKSTMREKKIGLNNIRSKIILCIETGIFFYSIREAAETFNIKEITLYFQLTGKNKNKTNLIIT